MGYPFFKYGQYTKAFAVSTKCRKVEWGYGRILVRDGANAGWINYMLKDRQKSEFDGFVDGAVARLVGIEGGVVSGVFNLESSGVGASDRRPRHDERYHEDRVVAAAE